MLIIRLTRRGRRNDPSFRLVVSEKSNPIKGKFLEELGYYNPKLKTKAFKNERILHWIEKGAKCSPTVNNLLVSAGIIAGEKVKAWRPKKNEATKPTGEQPEHKVKKEVPAEEMKTENLVDKSADTAPGVAPEAKTEKAD